MTSPLDNICGQGQPLEYEAPDAQEYAELNQSAFNRLRDAARPELSLESRFDLAYNAAHALCLAALRWHGYRPRYRYIVFQVLPHTLKLGPEVWRVRSYGRRDNQAAFFQLILRGLMTRVIRN